MKRMPENDSMDTYEDAVAYLEAARKCLYFIDDGFVESILKMGVNRGKVLDIGCGAGLITAKLAKRNPDFEIIGIDASEHMVELAQQVCLEERLNLDRKVSFLVGDAYNLSYPDNYFDIVISHSLLHHLEYPVRFLNEVSRVVKEDGAVNIRDIKRPPTGFFHLYLAVFGAEYKDRMKKMYRNSLMAGYIPREIKQFLAQSDLKGAQTRRFFVTHYGIEKKSSRNEQNKIEPMVYEDALSNFLRKCFV